MMICGDDAHGGNHQRGCGKPFVWTEGQPNSALPYEADLRGAADYAAEEEGDGVGNGDDGDLTRTARCASGGCNATPKRSTRARQASLSDAPDATSRLLDRGGSACSAMDALSSAWHVYAWLPPPGPLLKLTDGRAHQRGHCPSCSAAAAACILVGGGGRAPVPPEQCTWC